MQIGQEVIITSGLDTGRTGIVKRIENDIIYVESSNGEGFASGAGILTVFGFLDSRIRPADPNALYQGLHIVVLHQTADGKKNKNKKAKGGMKGVILNLNKKRSLVRLENGVECLVGNNLLKKDETYQPPQPVKINNGDVIVFHNKEEDRKDVGLVVFYSSSIVRLLCNREYFQIDRFDVIKRITLKDIVKKTILVSKKKKRQELVNKIWHTKQEIKNKMSGNLEDKTTLKLCSFLYEKIEEYEKDLKNLKDYRVFIGSRHSFTYTDKPSDIKGLFLEYLMDKKDEHKYSVEYFGNRVEKVGNVFLEKGTFKRIDIDKDSIVRSEKKPTSLDEYIGIEFECIVDCNREELNDHLIERGLHFNCKLVSDGSLRTDSDKGGYSIEIKFMAKRKSYKSKLKDLITLIHDLNGYVNESCGMHVHFDMRYRDHKSSYKKLYNAQHILSLLVPKERRNNSYCKPSLETWERQEIRREKYSAINIVTYSKLKTIEVRLHHGCIDYDEVCNWVDLIHAILDNPETIKFRSYKLFNRILKLNSRLSKYVEETVKKYA